MISWWWVTWYVLLCTVPEVLRSCAKNQSHSQCQGPKTKSTAVRTWFPPPGFVWIPAISLIFILFGYESSVKDPMQWRRNEFESGGAKKRLAFFCSPSNVRTRYHTMCNISHTHSHSSLSSVLIDISSDKMSMSVLIWALFMQIVDSYFHCWHVLCLLHVYGRLLLYPEPSDSLEVVWSWF